MTRPQYIPITTDRPGPCPNCGMFVPAWETCPKCTVRRAGGSFDREVIRCKNPNCHHIVATRDNRAGIAPVGGHNIDKDGRLVVRCACGQTNKFKPDTVLRQGGGQS